MGEFILSNKTHSVHLMLALLLTRQTSLGTVLLNRREELISHSISWLHRADFYLYSIFKEKYFKDVRPQTNTTAVVLKASSKSTGISLPLLNLRLYLFSQIKESMFSKYNKAFSSQSAPFVRIPSSSCQPDPTSLCSGFSPASFQDHAL